MDLQRVRPVGRPRVLEELEVRDVLQGLFDIRRQANADTVAPYIAALSAVRLGLTPPDAVEEAMPDAPGLAAGFDRYRSTLAELGAVDFDEQIYRAIEILVTDPGARAAAQARCRRLLVDEFQDLTPAHLLMIRLLAAPGYDCFGVGDDDQVIYGYSGATPEFLIGFPRYFPGAAHHPLEVNYRCPPSVVDAARNLLSYNHRRLDKTIRWPEGRGDGEAVAAGPLAGAGPVAVRTAPATAWPRWPWTSSPGGGTPASDPAISPCWPGSTPPCCPSRWRAREAGIPCATPLGAKALGRTGMRTAFAYLRIGSDPGHIRREDVRDTVRRPSRGIAPMVVDMLTKARSTSVTDIRRLAGRLSGRDVPKLLAYADDLDTVSGAAGLSTTAALRAVRVGIGLNGTMDVLDSSRREADRSTHADDLVALEAVAALHPEASTFEEWLRGVLTRPPAEGPTVLLSTVHRIKGKEWGNVIVFGASEGLFPHRLSDDEEGERRVLPRGADPGPDPGGRAGRRRRPVGVPGRARRIPAAPGPVPAGPDRSGRDGGTRGPRPGAPRPGPRRGAGTGPGRGRWAGRSGPCASGGRPWPERSRARLRGVDRQGPDRYRRRSPAHPRRTGPVPRDRAPPTRAVGRRDPRRPRRAAGA